MFNMHKINDMVSQEMAFCPTALIQLPQIMFNYAYTNP